MSTIVDFERVAHDLRQQLDSLRAELDRVTRERDEAITLWRTADRYALQAQIDAASAELEGYRKDSVRFALRIAKLEAALREIASVSIGSNANEWIRCPYCDSGLEGTHLWSCPVIVASRALENK